MMAAMEQTAFVAQRAGVWGAAAAVFGFTAINTLGAPDAGGRLFWGVLTAGAGVLLVRALNVRAVVELDHLRIHGMARTRTYHWDELLEVELEPLHRPFPLASVAPYVALAVRLRDGRSRRFEDIAVPERDRAQLAPMIRAIADRIDRAPIAAVDEPGP